MELWKGAFIWYLINIYYPIYRKKGLTEPKKVTQYTDKYRKASDVYMEYLEENVIITKKKSDKIQISELYTFFRHWYGESYAKSGCPSKKELSEYMSNHDYTIRNGHVYYARYNNGEDEEADTIAEGLDE